MKKVFAITVALVIGLSVGEYMQNKHDEELARKKNFERFKVITIPYTKQDAEWLQESGNKFIDDPYTDEIEVYEVMDYVIGFDKIQIAVDR